MELTFVLAQQTKLNEVASNSDAYTNYKHGVIPVGKLCESQNGKLYGMTHSGGAYNLGVLYKWDPISDKYLKMLDFNRLDNGANPQGSLIMAQNGKLYGMTEYGGANNEGLIFEWDPEAEVFLKMLDLSRYESGRFPYDSELMQADNGKFYGMTSMGGANDLGVLFEWDPNTNILTKKVDFDGANNGSTPRGSLMQADNGKLYGMTWGGGINEIGVLFEWDPVNNIFVKKLDFNSETSGYPIGSLMQVEENKFYGATSISCGIVFEWNLQDNNFKSIHRYVYEDQCWINGCEPISAFVNANNGKIYWIARGAGCSGGILCEYDPANEIYRKVYMFEHNIGAHPTSLMQATNGKIYITTTDGLSNQNEIFERGAIYVYDPIVDICEKKFGFDMTANPSINLSCGLVADYPFNGNANDESGYNHHGVIDGATLTTDRFGNMDNAYFFNKNGEISISNYNIPSDSITICCWVNVLNPTGIQDFISKHTHTGDVELLIRSIDNKYTIEWTIGDMYFRLADDNGYYAIDSEHPRFDFLTLVYNGTKVDLYINNQLVATRTTSGRIANNSLPMVFGRYAAGNQDNFNGILDDIRIYNRALNPAEINALYHYTIQNTDIIINTPEINTFENTTFEIPVYVNSVKPADKVIAYQFDLAFDSQKIQYQDYRIDGTLSENGSLQINPTTQRLFVAWADQTPISGTGILLYFKFKALEKGITMPVISNFLLNTDTIRNIENGQINIKIGFGDVDANTNIQAYDAALALQYSVGLDPLPAIDPLPWENWRIIITNVDDENGISAYDASLILQYTVGSINSFPVQGYLKRAAKSQADVSVAIENGKMVFRSSGDVQGLNVRLEENSALFGSPETPVAGALIASNYTSADISVGLAMSNAPAENEVILTIPVIDIPEKPVVLNLLINNREKQINLGTITGISETFQKAIEMYPNPAKTVLYFKNLSKNATITLYDLNGRKIRTFTPVSDHVDIGDLASGIYSIRIQSDNIVITKKIIKD